MSITERLNLVGNKIDNNDVTVFGELDSVPPLFSLASQYTGSRAAKIRVTSAALEIFGMFFDHWLDDPWGRNKTELRDKFDRYLESFWKQRAQDDLHEELGRALDTNEIFTVVRLAKLYQTPHWFIVFPLWSRRARKLLQVIQALYVMDMFLPRDQQRPFFLSFLKSYWVQLDCENPNTNVY